uniref:Uncharacterized protein n=1 Tax=Cucumis melo TaxID=3656 RepID=A0A9I9EC88_CUCME
MALSDICSHMECLHRIVNGSIMVKQVINQEKLN